VVLFVRVSILPQTSVSHVAELAVKKVSSTCSDEETTNGIETPRLAFDGQYTFTAFLLAL
jgi:hypothetical protein